MSLPYSLLPASWRDKLLVCSWYFWSLPKVWRWDCHNSLRCWSAQNILEKTGGTCVCVHAVALGLPAHIHPIDWLLHPPAWDSWDTHSFSVLWGLASLIWRASPSPILVSHKAWSMDMGGECFNLGFFWPFAYCKINQLVLFQLLLCHGS